MDDWAGAFTLYLRTDRKTERTAQTYVETVRYFERWCCCRDLCLEEADREAIRLYLVEEQKRVSANTVVRALAVLRKFYAWRDDDDHRTHGLRIKPEEIEPRLPLDREELTQLLAACRSDRDRVMVTLAHRLGLRLSELVGLRDEDVDLRRGLILIHRKGLKRQQLPIDAELRDMLRPFLGTGYLWRLQTGGPMTTKRAKRMMQQLCERADLRSHWHRLRTTFANEAIEAGIPIEQLRVLMGHKNLASTARYAEHTIQLQAFEAMRRMTAGKLVAE